MKILIKSIDVGSRSRKDFGDIIGLANSLHRLGLIAPIVVCPLDNNHWTLIAGERRLRAAIFLGWSEIDAVVREDCSDEQKFEIELEENIRRKSLIWAEECEIKLKLDELKRKQLGSAVAAGKYAKEGWKLQDTATLLDEAVGTVSQDITLAKAMREDKSLAIQLMKYPKNVAMKKLKQIKERKRLELSASKLVITSEFRLGDATVLIDELKDNSIDLWITDPPFGVEQIMESKGSYTDMAGAKDNLTIPEMEDLYEILLPKIFKKMKETAHFYIFFGNEFYPFLMKALEGCGFHVDPVPIIWYKMRTTTPFRGLSYMQCYEPILFGCKPPRAKYLSKPASNLFQISPVESGRKIHVFEKPSELLKKLIEESSNPGDTVLDTFAGSGSTILAARELKRKGIGFEDNAYHYRAALERLNEKGE